MDTKFYEFYNPVKIVSGHNSIENLPFELEQLGVKRPFIITENYIYSIGLVDLVLQCLRDSNVGIGSLFKDVPPDSSNIIVNEAASIFRENSCDCIIAIGGGSVIDTAKGVNIVVTEETNDLIDLMGSEILKKNMKPLIVIPTTSGTGSEATLVAVIANTEKNVKMTFNSYKLVPNVAILDPAMTLTLPPKLTATTGIDSLTHAIEAYTSLQKNPISDAFAISSISFIKENLIEAVKNGNNKAARLGMANASLIAGIAFSNSMVGIVHAIGHAIGGVAHVPHGIAMTILLPYGMKYNLPKVEKYYSELLLYLTDADEYCNTPKDQRALKAIQVIQDLTLNLKELSSIPITLKEAGVKKELFENIARTALNDGSISYNPRQANYDDIIDILNAAYE